MRKDELRVMCGYEKSIQKLAIHTYLNSRRHKASTHNNHLKATTPPTHHMRMLHDSGTHSCPPHNCTVIPIWHPTNSEEQEHSCLHLHPSNSSSAIVTKGHALVPPAGATLNPHPKHAGARAQPAQCLRPLAYWVSAHPTKHIMYDTKDYRTGIRSKAGNMATTGLRETLEGCPSVGNKHSIDSQGH